MVDLKNSQEVWCIHLWWDAICVPTFESGLWLVHWTEDSGSCSLWLLRLGPKKSCSFFLHLLNSCFLDTLRSHLSCNERLIISLLKWIEMTYINDKSRHSSQKFQLIPGFELCQVSVRGAKTPPNDSNLKVSSYPWVSGPPWTETRLPAVPCLNSWLLKSKILWLLFRTLIWEWYLINSR